MKQTSKVLSVILTLAMMFSVIVISAIPSSAATYTWPTLKSGTTGYANEITALQYLLKSYGYYTPTPTGTFDATTTTAVKNFQTSKNLTSDGAVGTNTWTSLVSGRTVKRGSADADAAKAIQYLLKNKFGFSSIVIDGAYGNASIAAVSRFQRALTGSPLHTVVDGIVGSNTWNNLIAATKAQADITPMWYIYVLFPTNRNNIGNLYLYDATGAQKLSMQCKGLGQNNGNWWLTNENTPLGCFGAELSAGTYDTASYGPYKVVQLNDSQVGTATKAAGGVARSGVWIHSAGTNLTDLSSIRSHGCLKIKTADHNSLVNQITTLKGSGFVIISE